MLPVGATMEAIEGGVDGALSAITAMGLMAPTINRPSNTKSSLSMVPALLS
jgi:hypothetical protein